MPRNLVPFESMEGKYLDAWYRVYANYTYSLTWFGVESIGHVVKRWGVGTWPIQIISIR